MCILRQEKTKPILEDFLKWLSKKSLQIVPQSLLGKAVSYTLNQWGRLEAYLKHGEVTPDNNAAENAICPFVVGRKNWLFAGSPKGAEASAGLYSLIETAKANGLEPYKYLRYLFEHLPFADSDDDHAQLLPSNLSPAELNLSQGVTGV
jgi:transposase